MRVLWRGVGVPTWRALAIWRALDGRCPACGAPSSEGVPHRPGCPELGIESDDDAAKAIAADVVASSEECRCLGRIGTRCPHSSRLELER